jgi:hypothetical protein
VLIVAIVGLQLYGNSKNSKLAITSFGSDVRISHAQSGAFGNLATLSLATGGKGGAAPQTAAAPVSTDAVQSFPAYGVGGGAMGTGTSGKMIAPYPYHLVNYKYVYKGSDLNLTSPKLDVLKKQAPDASSLSASLSALGLGLVNLNSFPGSKVQSVSFNQDNGYNIYVDLTSGMVNISGYFDVKPMAVSSGASDMSLCPRNGCLEPSPIKESDIPDDATVIAAANAFLSEHGIATSAYGAPEVSNDFRVQNKAMLFSSPKSMVYWPDSISVVYPYKVAGQEVYDESGNKSGLNVQVSVRSHKVTGVWNLSTQNYQASSYDAETDSGRILKVAENGGLYGYYGDPSGKTIEVELGTPKLQYVQMWDYQMNTSQQLLVPSLVFPVTKQASDGDFYRKSVVVPLIKSILDRDQNFGGPIKIMEGAGGSTGSGGGTATPAPAIVPKATK